ncbi:MAG: hypothetical protein JW938_01540 [Candidatus Omnitrophica bacterium]|nr:hypothetical protein [Candidatus Omnitrophota bacterium]
MKIHAQDIEALLPNALREICHIGICDPEHLERCDSHLCHIPLEYGGPKYSARPRDVMPTVKSIIILAHYTPIALDYSVEDIILEVAVILWKKLRIKTHVLDRDNKPDKQNIVGNEYSYLKRTGYDTRNKILLLKDIAYYAGLGQFGKNSLIINPRFGSDIKLQVLFSETKMYYNTPMHPKEYPGCKDCTICVNACPSEQIDNFSLFASHKDHCKRVVNDTLTLIGRACKQDAIWDEAVYDQKSVCRICQSFCPVNADHYIRDKLIFAKKDTHGKISFYFSGSKNVLVKGEDS